MPALDPLICESCNKHWNQGEWLHCGDCQMWVCPDCWKPKCWSCDKVLCQGCREPARPPEKGIGCHACNTTCVECGKAEAVGLERREGTDDYYCALCRLRRLAEPLEREAEMQARFYGC